MQELPESTDKRLIVGTDGFSDAGVFEVAPDLLLVQSLDFFAPLVDDPFVFGQIAAANSLSDVFAMGGRPVDLFAEPAIPRRSIYGFIDRDVIAQLFSTFDMADPSACTALRPETTVPQQALFALNSNFVMEQASHLAEFTAGDGATDDSRRIHQMYHQVFARDPEPDELSMALRYIQSLPDNAEPNPWVRYAQILLASNEFVFVD